MRLLEHYEQELRRLQSLESVRMARGPGPGVTLDPNYRMMIKALKQRKKMAPRVAEGLSAGLSQRQIALQAGLARNQVSRIVSEMREFG